MQGKFACLVVRNLLALVTREAASSGGFESLFFRAAGRLENRDTV